MDSKLAHLVSSKKSSREAASTTLVAAQGNLLQDIDHKTVRRLHLLFKIGHYWVMTSCGRVIRDFEREAKTRCNF